MNNSPIYKQYKEIETLIINDSLYESLKRLKQLKDDYKLTYIVSSLENVESSYKFLIQYVADGIPDPNRFDFYKTLKLNLLSINDLIYYYIKTHSCVIGLSSYRIDDINSIYCDFCKCIDKLSIYNGIPESEIDDNVKFEIFKQAEDYISILFDFIWLHDFKKTTSCELLFNIYNNPNVPIQYKGFLLSAIFLSLNICFDENKYLFLLDLYKNPKDEEIRMRTLVIIYALSYQYDARLNMSHKIKNAFNELKDNGIFRKEIELVLLQHMNSINTEYINKKMQAELIPEILKISPDIYKNIKSNKFDASSNLNEENQDLYDLLNNSKIESKIRELNELQINGGDVFMSTFSHLKNDNFFTSYSNWFFPYYPKNTVLHGINEKFLNIINNAPYLCDSDKYSFALTLTKLPTAEADLMLSQVSSQNNALGEIEADNINNSIEIKKKIIRNYTHDLYRFFKLKNKELKFYNYFNSIPFVNNGFLSNFIVDNNNILSAVIESCLKNKDYKTVLSIINEQIASGVIDSSLYLKGGYCYQCLGKISFAIEYYLKAEYLTENNIWLYKHIAQCYKLIGKYNEAIEYLLKVEQLNLSDVKNILNIGHLYLDSGHINKALDYYYKANYMGDDSIKTYRPIAWCEFVNGNFEKSKIYYEKIISSENPSSEDFMNYGHLIWASEGLKSAIPLYKESYKQLNRNYTDFRNNFLSDSDILKNKGIDVSLISFIVDKVSYDT